jgi:hypothetical protein
MEVGYPVPTLNVVDGDNHFLATLGSFISCLNEEAEIIASTTSLTWMSLLFVLHHQI